MSTHFSNHAMTILIAEDEALTRMGVSYFISKMGGYVIVGEATNGSEALEKVLLLKPDVMILDMKMPVMTGLEVLERLHELEYSETRILVLSGYDDFKFVRNALCNGAKDYLLKPSTFEQLRDALERIQGEIEIDSTRKEEERKQSNLIHQSYPIMLGQFYRAMIEQRLEENLFAEKQRLFNLPATEYCVCLASPDHLYSLRARETNSEVDLLDTNITNRLLQCIHKYELSYASAFPLATGVYAIVFAVKDCELEVLVKHVRHIRDDLVEQIGSSVTISIGSYVSLHKLHESYNDAMQKLKQRIFMGDSSIIKQYISTDGELNIELPTDFAKQFLHAIKYRDNISADMLMNSLFIDNRRKNIPREEWLRFCYDIALEVTNLMGNYCLGQNENSHMLESIREISVLTSIHDIKDWLQNIVKTTMDHIHASAYGQPLIIRKALTYIEEHYKENITLSDLANHVALSLNYFSTLFKQETGRTVLESISRRRIEEAKRLLAVSPLNISEIAFQLGYDNPRYFSEVFHRYEGITPTQYRKSL